MDSFDDLLAPSRHILEENPFADPFAKRSNSPDPWASPFSAQLQGKRWARLAILGNCDNKAQRF